MPTSVAPTPYGPQTQAQFLASVKTNTVDTAKMQQSSTNFQWAPTADAYYMPKTQPVDRSALPPPAVRQQIAASSSSSSVSGHGTTVLDHPVQLKEAVKHLSGLPTDNPLAIDSLQPEARKAFDARIAQFNNQSYPGKIASVAGNLVKEAFVDPMVGIMTRFPAPGIQNGSPNPVQSGQGSSAIDHAPNLTPQFKGPIVPLDTQDAITQKVNDLMAKKQYSQARSVFDAWQKTQIENTDTLDLLHMNSSHPVINSLTRGLAVNTMQFVALRNAPFMQQLGDAMEAKVATTVGDSAARASLLSKEGMGGMGTAVMSKFSKGMVNLAGQMAGDVAANTVLPVMNFDFEHRPIQDLPKHILTNLAFLVPTMVAMHYVGNGLGDAAATIFQKAGQDAPAAAPDMAALIAKYGSEDDIPMSELDPTGVADAAAAHDILSSGGSIDSAAHAHQADPANALGQAVIKVAAKVIGMAKSLRIPITKDVSDAFEKGIMGEEDNAFTRIVGALPEVDQATLRSYVQMKRGNMESERFQTSLNPNQFNPFSFGERRPAGITGPLDDNMGRPRLPAEPAIEAASTAPEITQIEKDALTRIGKSPDTTIKTIQGTQESRTMDMARTRRSPGEVVRATDALDTQKQALSAQYEYERMVSDMRQFREGLQQGRVNSAADILEYQQALEQNIVESLPMKYRGRALPLIKRATTVDGLQKAVDRLDKIVQNVKSSEMGLGAEQGAIKRQTTSAIKDILTNPPPDIELVQPYERSIFFSKLLEIPFGEKNMKAANEKLTELSTKLYSSLTPLKDLDATWAAVKQYPKQVSSEVRSAVGELNTFFKNNFTDHAQVDEFSKYRILKMMNSRAEQGMTNPGSPTLGIPNNPDPEWIASELATMDASSPQLQQINSEFTDMYNRYTLDQYKGRIPDPVLNEWKQKYPDHISFFYEKYLNDSSSHPQGKSYNFTARDYLKAIKGAEGLDVNPNLYDTSVKAFQRAIGDKYTDGVATTLRKEMGVEPLKMYSTSDGRQRFQMLLDGKPYDFDKQDLEKDLVPGLQGQRVMYSKYDNQAFIVPKGVAELVSNQREKTPAILQAFSNLTHKWQDLTTTYRASFALISNPIKDLEFAMINTDHSVKEYLGAYLSSARDLLASALYKDNPIMMKRMTDGSFAMDEGFATSIKAKYQDALNWMSTKVGTDGWEKFAQDFAASGGDQGGYITQRTRLNANEQSFFKSLGTVFTGKDIEYSVSNVSPKFIANSGIRNMVKLKNGAMALTFDNIAAAGSFMEKIPRAAEFKLVLKDGGSLQAAGAAASDITLDFTEQGSSTAVKWIRAFLPYKFTAFRGNVKLAAAAIGKGKEGMAATIAARRILTGVVAPAIGFWYLAKKAGIWDRTDPSIQNNYWMIPTGMTYTDQYGNVQPIVITPRMGEMSQKLAPIIFTMLDHFVGKDPSAFNRVEPQKMLDQMISSLTPAIRAPIEQASNYSFFQHQPIDPDFMQQLPVELRRYKGTTTPGTVVGNTLGISPNQGDYLLNSLAPAPFDYYKMLTKENGDKPNWLTVAQSLKLLQVPNAFFADKDLSRARTDLMTMMRKVARQQNVTPAEREQSTRDIWSKMKEIDDLVKYKADARAQNPLNGTSVNQPQTANVDMGKIRAFAAASKEERATMIQSLTPDEVQYLRSHKGG